MQLMIIDIIKLHFPYLHVICQELFSLSISVHLYNVINGWSNLLLRNFFYPLD